MKSKMKLLKVLLVLVAVVSIGVAVSYPIRYKVEMDSNNSELEDLSSMRRRVLEEQHIIPEDIGEGRPQFAAVPEDAHDAPQAPGDREDGETAAPLDETETPGEPEATEIRADAPTVSPPDIVEETVGQAPAGDVQSGASEEPAAGGQHPATGPQADEAAPAGTEAPLAEAAGAEAETPLAGTTETHPAEAEAPAAENRTVQPEAPAANAEGNATEPPAADNRVPATQAPAGNTQVNGTQPPADSVAKPVRDAVTPVPVTPTPGLMDLILDDYGPNTSTPRPTSTPTPTPSPTPSPTPDRRIRDDPDPYKYKVKVRFDANKILPELRDIYELNHDLVGWLYIDDTNIDYPVVQSDDGKYYLTHDFYGRSNANGQIILEDKCDPYTPSYNLVISGHHMNSGSMFGRLGRYKDKEYWQDHKIIEFDTLMARKQYVIFGAFYSADYDEYEEGFRYSADIQYKLDADMWLGEIEENQIYETGVQVAFGDEFITLTTCDHSKRYNGRFVVVARRIREGERIL